MASKTGAKSPRAKQRIILLDAHAIIHRAFHALPDFTASSGEPTGALYGLSAMLIKLIADFKPDHIAACMDLPEPTHRHEVYEAYKGTREKTDEALSTQLDRARDVFSAFNIPMYEASGFEADDCLGTIVAQLSKQKDIEVIIASGDMDTLQLVSGKRVTVFTLRKGLNDTIRYDEAAVISRFGFEPKYIPDYKGLRGDPSDNIKGVKGIGEKAASELVQAFGGVNTIYRTLHKHPEQFAERGIKPRVTKLLEEGEDDALFSTMLATIRRDAPITYTLPKVPWHQGVDPKRVLTLFDDLEFRTLGNRFTALMRGDKSDVPIESDEAKEDVDPVLCAESTLALWLLHSDMTNPTQDDVLRWTKTDSIESAHTKLIAAMREAGRVFEIFETIEKPLLPIVKRLNETGVVLNVAYLQSLSKEYHAELDSIRTQIIQHAGRDFNINSPSQLSEVLFNELHLSIPRQKKTEGGKLSTRESELEKLRGAHPVIELILSYREWQKLLSTYVDNLPKLVGPDNRLHTEFLQSGTTTGRISSRNPNLQNIPIRTESGKRVRDAFVASEGMDMVAIDYSQIELRIAAGLSGDPQLVKVFQGGGDVHQAVASQVFGVPPELVDREMRRRAKVINFGILYGMGVNALRQNLGESVSREEAARFLAGYFENFSGLAQFLENTKRSAERLGYTETLFGRRRTLGGFQSSLPHVRAQAERMALNAPIQGTQADIIKKAMISIDRWIEAESLRESVHMLLQVHDELVFEITSSRAKELAGEIRGIMEGIVSKEELHGVLLVADVSIGPNWGTLEKQ